MNNHAVVGRNSRITLHFSLSLSGGQVIDSNFSSDPATFSYGDGSLLPGFEQTLLGLSVGKTQRVTIAAEDAFGIAKSENIKSFDCAVIEEMLAQQIPISESGDPLLLQPGLMLSFSDAAGGELPGVISAVDNERAQVDFNHPLAGKDIVFEVHIVSIIKVDDAPIGGASVVK